MLLRKIIVFFLVLFFAKNNVVAQDSMLDVVPKWNVKWLPLAFANPVNPNLEFAVATRLKEKILLQASVGYIDRFYLDRKNNRGFRSAIDVQILQRGSIRQDDIVFFVGAQLMYRQLHKSELELPVSRFDGAYQEFMPYNKGQDSWYLHCTIGEYYFSDSPFYANWKIALGARTYREFEVTQLPEDAEINEESIRFGPLDGLGEGWKFLPSLRFSLNIGFGW